MFSSTKVTVTPVLSTSSIAKSMETYITASDLGDGERSMGIMEKRNKYWSCQIKTRSKTTEKTSNNKVDGSKLNEIKNEVQNIDGCLARSGHCKSRFLPMIYEKKELEFLLRLLKVLE